MTFHLRKFLLLIFFSSRVFAGHDMRFESIEGDVTTNEYQSFVEHLEQQFPQPPTNNIDNLMVDEKDGARQHGLQTFYEFTHDRRVLDKAVDNAKEALYSGTENGDVIEHIVNTARLILENSNVWNEPRSNWPAPKPTATKIFIPTNATRWTGRLTRSFINFTI